MSDETYVPDAPDALDILCEQVVAELRTKGSLAGIEISVDDPKALGPECDQLVEKAGGLLLVLEIQSGSNSKPAVFGALHLDDTRFTIVAYEHPELNRCAQGRRKTARACVLACLRALHGYRPAVANVMVQGLGFDPVDDPSLLAYRANFKTSLAIKSDADLVERRPV